MVEDRLLHEDWGSMTLYNVYYVNSRRRRFRLAALDVALRLLTRVADLASAGTSRARALLGAVDEATMRHFCALRQLVSPILAIATTVSVVLHKSRIASNRNRISVASSVFHHHQASYAPKTHVVETAHVSLLRNPHAVRRPQVCHTVALKHAAATRHDRRTRSLYHWPSVLACSHSIIIDGRRINHESCSGRQNKRFLQSADKR